MASQPAKPAAAASGAGAASARQQPLIPIELIDAPQQRLWAVSAALALQAYKLYFIFLSDDATLSFALLIDLALILVLSRLRIPRLDFADAKWTFLGLLIGTADWLLLGGWRSALSLIGLGSLSSWLGSLFGSAFSNSVSISEHRVRISDLIKPSSYLLGQHTIHILPYSTATFGSSVASCHCVGADRSEVLIPIVFNNTDPYVLQYSATSFENPDEQTFHNITIPQSSLISIHNPDLRGEGNGDSDWDEVEAELIGDAPSSSQRAVIPRDGERSKGMKKPRINHQKTFQLAVKQKGRIRLERVMDKNRMDARISRGEIIIVECPTTALRSPQQLEHKCPSEEASLEIEARGVAPLEVEHIRTFTPYGGGRVQTDQHSISHISQAKVASPLTRGEGKNTDDLLAVALNRQKPSKGSASGFQRDFSWAVSQGESVPVSLDLSKAGSYHYEVQSVKDACGNVHKVHSKGHDVPSASIQVHPRARARLSGCSAEQPLQLLRGGPAKELVIKAQDAEPGADWTASIHFEPETSANGTMPWAKKVAFSDAGIARFEATAPGTYTVEEISGKFCTGEVGSPWSCPVVELPTPSADISFSTIEDVCAGSVGVNAMAILSGTPPFTLYYEIRRANAPPMKQERTIRRTREEFEFRPSTEGKVQYRFTGLADANYKDLKLDGPVFDQVVHPLASARFLGESSRHGSNEKVIMRSCEGKAAQATVALEGTGPFDLTYAVRSGSKAEHRTIKGIAEKKHTLDIDLPPQLNSQGGILTVSLVSIKDGKDCERPLTTADLNIEVRKVRPTASFVIPSGRKGESLLLEEQEARLPVRLEGEGPWKLEYQRKGDNVPVSTTIRQADSTIVVDRAGTYELVGIHDAFCQGTVAPSAKEWQVGIRTRPSASFDSSAGVKATRNNSLIRSAVCRGTPDSVDLRLSGHSPVQVTCEHRAPAWVASPEEHQHFLENDGAPSHNGARERETFSAAQNVTVYQLSTDSPGWHTYQLLEVGDTSYPLAHLQKGLSPPTLEQMVHALPSANFQPSGKGVQKASYCLGDSISAQKAAAPVVQLTGTPPFTLEFELYSLSSVRPKTRQFVREGIRSHTASLELTASEAESFKLTSTGSWAYRLISLQDGNGCVTWNTPGEGEARLGGASAKHAPSIEVAETASIAPMETRRDYCVGEEVEFLLQGSAPWTVEYSFNDHLSTASVRNALFSRVAEKEGTMKVRSVAHQQNKCKRTFDDDSASSDSTLVKRIHPLPRVKVRDGGHYIEDLREGGSAEIVFSLRGTPPFSLTYQHLEEADVFTHPKVLATHTVAGIVEDEFRIVTAEAGTWRVTSLSDRWCSVNIDGMGKHKLDHPEA